MNNVNTLGMDLEGVKLTQEMHSCGDQHDTARLDVNLFDAGAGKYLVLNAFEIAFDSKEEINELAKLLCNILDKSNSNEMPGITSI